MAISGTSAATYKLMEPYSEGRPFSTLFLIVIRNRS